MAKTNPLTTALKASGVAEFKRDMAQAEQAIKTLAAEAEENKESFIAAGDAEIYFEQKIRILNQQMTLQQSVIEKGEAALKAMKENGVDQASAAYQTMQQKVINARTTLIKMDTQLKSTTDQEKDTKTEANNLATAVEGIGKKQNLDAVQEGQIGRASCRARV